MGGAYLHSPLRLHDGYMHRDNVLDILDQQWKKMVVVVM
jgi:hypothetical protein